MRRLLLADRIKDRRGSFLAPLIPALEQQFEVRFHAGPPGPELAAGSFFLWSCGWYDLRQPRRVRRFARRARWSAGCTSACSPTARTCSCSSPTGTCRNRGRDAHH